MIAIEPEVNVVTPKWRKCPGPDQHAIRRARVTLIVVDSGAAERDERNCCGDDEPLLQRRPCVCSREKHLTRIRLQCAIYLCLHRGSLPENTAALQRCFRARIMPDKISLAICQTKSRSVGSSDWLGLCGGDGECMLAGVCQFASDRVKCCVTSCYRYGTRFVRLY